MPQRNREEFLPQWAAIILSVAAGLLQFALYAAALIGTWAMRLEVLWYQPTYGTIILVILCVVVVVLAWIPTRILYHALRWRDVDVEVEDTFCPHCDYNLTGNVSGICPECGNPIEASLIDTISGSSNRTDEP